MNNEMRYRIGNEFRSTELGLIRINKNLKLRLSCDDKIKHAIREIILSTPISNVEKIGKNFYFKNNIHDAILTIHSRSLTVITAKKIS